MVAVGVVLGALAVVIGLAWFGRKWLYYAALFFIPFLLFYSTVFTNPQGIMNGLVGGLSYWVNAHGTNRVYQPAFYYALIEIPMYEFLPALGTIVAVLIAMTKRLWQSVPGQPFTSPAPVTSETPADPLDQPVETLTANPPVPLAALLVFWFASSLFIFSIAGERAPWLTVHIALPMILAAAWAIAWLIQTVPWGRLSQWKFRNYLRAATLGFFALLAVITFRAAIRAAYINYNNPLEYLVYAHHSAYPKVVYNEIEELSIRTTGALDMVVAYDNNVRYPYWWYMRHFPNKIDYGENPTRNERDAVVIVGSDENFSKLAPVVQKNYEVFKYPRIWWQNMDYWDMDWKNIDNERTADLTSQYAQEGKSVPPMNFLDYAKYSWGHIEPFFTDPQVRYAVWQIWFNRDYTAWAELRNSEAYTLTNWSGAQYMYQYVRKDITNLLWPLGASAAPIIQPVDPYAGIVSIVTPSQIIGSTGSEPGQFLSPRQVALAPDGSLYVADQLNHRIQHLSPGGEVLHVWGTKADVALGNAPGGTFNEPWGVAVSPDGAFVYVADTWNCRIQKFTADGEFVTMWGSGPDLGPQGFYGPRGIAVDGFGHVLVADTGNKRIVIYDDQGNYLNEFGGAGLQLGLMDEPVAIAIRSDGRLYVTDTWNQRVQAFSADTSGMVYSPLLEWTVEGWYGNSLENKPFVSVAGNGNVFITDPELCRVIEFTAEGVPVRVWDGCNSGAFGLPSGIAADAAGGVWVSDARNGALVYFRTNP